jgi:hypothetical protein
MSSFKDNFKFTANYNFGTDSVFVRNVPEIGAPFPPAPGSMVFNTDTHMLLNDGTEMLYN